MAGGLVRQWVEVHLRGGVGRDDWWQEVELSLARQRAVLIKIEGYGLVGEVHIGMVVQRRGEKS